MKKAEKELSKYEYLLKESESKERDAQIRSNAQLANRQLRQECRIQEEETIRLRQQLISYRQLLEKKKRELKDPKSLTFYIGLRINDRFGDGMFVYNSGRLVTMYHRLGESVPRGLVVVVDVPYSVLEPTHNKQDFADAKEFRFLIRALSEHAVCYSHEISKWKEGERLWSEFGYLKPTDVKPSNEPRFERKRRAEVPIIIQCDSCLKWRQLPFSSEPLSDFPDDWHCALNPDLNNNRCSGPEQKLVIPAGVFHRPSVSENDAAEKLAEEIKKKQEKLDKLKPQPRRTESRYVEKANNEIDTSDSVDSTHIPTRRSTRCVPEKKSIPEVPLSLPTRRRSQAVEETSDEEEEEEEEEEESLETTESSEVISDEFLQKKGRQTRSKLSQSPKVSGKTPVKKSKRVEQSESEEDDDEVPIQKVLKSSGSKPIAPSSVKNGKDKLANIAENYRACLQ